MSYTPTLHAAGTLTKNTYPVTCLRWTQFIRVVFSFLALLAITLSCGLLRAQSNAAALGDGIIQTFAGVPPGGTPAIGDNVAPNTYPMYAPTAVTTDAAGNVYIANADPSLPVILVVYLHDPMPPLLTYRINHPPSPFSAANATKGHIYVIAGTQDTSTVPCGNNMTGDLCGDDASALSATLNVPQGISIDGSGNLYIADAGSNSIRKVSVSNGFISTIVGDPMHVAAGYGGENVPALASLLSFPTAAVFDSFGNLYIADGNAIIRKVSAATNKISTVAGSIPDSNGAVTCTAGPCGDGGLATNAQLGYAPDLSIDVAGNLYIADENAATIRKVTDATQIIDTIAGTMPPASSSDPFPDTCIAAPCGNGGLAAAAFLNSPFYAALDSKGNLLIADTADGSLRYVDTTGVIHTVVGQITNAGYTGDSGKAIDAQLNGPQDFAFDSTGNLYIADTTNSVVRVVAAPPDLKPQTIEFGALEDATYGTAPITLEATASSGLAVSYTVTGPATVYGSTLTITGAGTITVTANQSGNLTYGAATPVSQTFTAGKATLTVTANDVSVVVGKSIPALSYTIIGFVFPDTNSVVSGSILLTTTDASTKGQYPITFVSNTDTLTAANYNFNFVAGTLFVTGSEAQSVTFPALPSITYGSANSTIKLNAISSAGSASQFPITYTWIGPADIQGSTLTITGAGSVIVTATQEGNNTYAAATATQTLTVKPAVLTITATNTTVPFGTLPSTFSYTATGFVGTDSTAIFGNNGPAFSTPATTSSAPGRYPINVTQGQLSAQNYTFVFVPGVLTIEQIPQTITFPEVPALTGSLGNTYQLQATASSGLPVQYSATGPVTILAGGILYVNGPGTATLTASQPGNTDYAAAQPVTQSINLGLVPLVVTALSYSRPYGAANPLLSYGFGAGGNSVSIIPGTVIGIPDVFTLATSSSPVGTYPIAISKGSLTSSLYAFSFVSGILTVTPPSSYSLTVNPAAVTIPMGQSRQVTVTITQINNYAGKITIGCAELPVGVSCTATPTDLTTTATTNGSGFVQGTLTISAGQTVASNHPSSGGTLAAKILWLPASTTCLLIMLRRRQMRRGSSLYLSALLFLLFCATSAITACGGGKGSVLSEVQAGTTQVEVTATGTGGPGTGDITQSVPLTVVIQ